MKKRLIIIGLCALIIGILGYEKSQAYIFNPTTGGSVIRTVTTSTIIYSKQLDSTSTTQVVTNTSTITQVYSFSVPGNTLGTSGAVIRLKAFGTLKDSSSTGTVTLTWTLKYGGSTCAAVGSSAVSTSTNTGGWGIDANISNASGTANNQICDLFATIKGGGTNTLNAGSAIPITVDSTAAQNLTLSLTTSVADTLINATMNSLQLMMDGATTTIVTSAQ